MLLWARSVIPDIHLTLHVRVHFKFGPTMMTVSIGTRRFLPLVSSVRGNFIAATTTCYSRGEDVDTAPDQYFFRKKNGLLFGQKWGGGRILTTALQGKASPKYKQTGRFG
jgi:hypothetical protein